MTYRDGHTCQVAPTESQVEEWEVVEAEIQVLRGTPAAKKAAAHHLLAVFERQEHISPDVFTRDEKGKSCPRVGYIAPTRKRVTHADVATKIRVRRSVGRHWCSRKGPERPNVFEVRLCSGAVPAGYNRIHLLSKVVHGKVVSLDPLTVLANVSLVAREPVTSSRSWYQYSIHYPRGMVVPATSEASARVTFVLGSRSGSRTTRSSDGARASTGALSVTCRAQHPPPVAVSLDRNQGMALCRSAASIFGCRRAGTDRWDRGARRGAMI